MSYQIVIIKKETRTVTKRGEYTVIDKRPWTDAELSEAMASHYGDKQDFLSKHPLKEVRDYAPSWQGVESNEIEILRQTVDDLDIPAVIKAVNGL